MTVFQAWIRETFIYKILRFVTITLLKDISRYLITQTRILLIFYIFYRHLIINIFLFFFLIILICFFFIFFFSDNLHRSSKIDDFWRLRMKWLFKFFTVFWFWLFQFFYISGFLQAGIEISKLRVFFAWFCSHLKLEILLVFKKFLI